MIKPLLWSMCLIIASCGQIPDSKVNGKLNSEHSSKPKAVRFHAMDAIDVQAAHDIFADLDDMTSISEGSDYDGIDAEKELQANFSTMQLADSPLRQRLAKICLEIESGWEKIKAKGHNRPAVENAPYIGLITLDQVVCKHRYIQPIQ